MSLNMPSPTKHRTTGTYYLFQRVPADLASKAKGQTLFLSVAGELCPVKAGVHVKVSLRTKEPGIAKVRYREADESLQAHWARLRSDIVELTHRQTLELAGMVFRTATENFDEEPGSSVGWRKAAEILTAAKTDPVLPAKTDETSQAVFRRAVEAGIKLAMDEVLANRGLQITEQSRHRLRMETIVALVEACGDNMRKAEGDYSRSPFADRFPAPAPIAKPAVRNGSGPKLTDLFDHWSKAQLQQGKSNSTTRRWKPIVASLVTFLGHDEASAVTDDDIIRWRTSILEAGQSTPLTFNRNHLAAIRSLYRQDNGKAANCPDPTLGLKWRVVAPVQGRPKGFVTGEAVAILRAADEAMSAPGKTSEVMRRVQQWVPWLCAYTGARVGEITQLRGADVLTIDGIECIRITPEAGTVKTRKFRDVPLHPHLIEMGFVAFARKIGTGPLFYPPDMASKTPWSITANKLAAWVRSSTGVTDPRVKPNHGWRHAFKTVCRTAGIDRFYQNGICGQSLGTTEGDKYGDTPMPAVFREIVKLPRWAV